MLDVAQAADPQRLQAAASRLARAAAAGGSDASFAAALDSAAPAAGGLGPPLSPFGARATAVPGHAAAESRQTVTNRKFEAMVLQSFVENILPKDSELFGDAASADMCRSLLAQQVADQIAKAGGIGIARNLQHFQDVQAHAAKPADAPGAASPAIPRA